MKELPNENQVTDSIEIRRNQWQEKLKELAIPDKYGNTVDANVTEMVAVLQLLGIGTLQSCEGHHSDSPWVEFGAERPKNFFVGEQELKTELMLKLGISPDEIEPNSPSYDKIKELTIEYDARDELIKKGAAYTPEFIEWQSSTAKLVDKLQSLITAFYANQPNTSENHSSQIFINFPYKTSKHIPYVQDTPFVRARKIAKNDPEENPDKILQSNQQEIERFTDFLKTYFFSK